MENKTKDPDGLKFWEVVLNSYGQTLEQAFDGIYIEALKDYFQLYFDEIQNKWLMRPIDPINN